MRPTLIWLGQPRSVHVVSSNGKSLVQYKSCSTPPPLPPSLPPELEQVTDTNVKQAVRHLFFTANTLMTN